MYKIVLTVMPVVFLLSCGSKPINSKRSASPINKNEAGATQTSSNSSFSTKKETIENIRISMLLNQNKFNQCFKLYLLKQNEPRQGWLVIRFRIYDNVARDMTLIQSYEKSLDQCFLNVVRTAKFDDLYYEQSVITVSYPFLIKPNGVDLSKNIEIN